MKRSRPQMFTVVVADRLRLDPRLRIRKPRGFHAGLGRDDSLMVEPTVGAQLCRSW
jgi:hypothetical protein